MATMSKKDVKNLMKKYKILRDLKSDDSNMNLA